MRYAIFELSVVLAINCLAEAASPFDREKFDQLSQPQRLDSVLAGLELREQKLSNFSYRAVEDHTNVDNATGARTPTSLVTLELKRAGEAYLFHQSSTKFHNRRETYEDHYWNWDGKKSRHLIPPPYGGVPYPTASIRNDEFSHLYQWRYNAMLGFRVELEGTTLAAWLRSPVNLPVSLTTIEFAEEGGRKVIRVTLVSGGLQDSLAFDPADNFLLLRWDEHYQRGAGFNDWHQEVLQTKQIAGLTIPIKMLYRVATSAANWKTEIVTEASEFKIGEVKPADTMLVFPAGAQVHDYTTETPQN